MKNRIRLTEAQLHNVIKQSVKRVLKENFEDEMAIQKINSGANKGGVKMSGEDYQVITKVYHDLIEALESNDEPWVDSETHQDSPLGGVLRKIWEGPVRDLGMLLRSNSSLGEWQQINKGIKNGW